MGLSIWGRAWAGCAVLGAVLLGGCAGGEMTPIRSEAEFDQLVLKSHKVVLVDFYKGWCPTCIAADGMMDKLARDYKGRGVVAKFELMRPWLVVTSPKLKEQYDIHFFPTVILFVDGKETIRFILNYDGAVYRKALDGQVGGPTTQKETPATRPGH